MGLEGQPAVESVLTIKDTYSGQVIIQNNKFYYRYNDTKESKKRVYWCFENHIPVWGYGSLDDFESEQGGETAKGDKEPPESQYQKVGNVYLQTPDLKNLNPEATYYVTYDQNGENPKIAGRIDRIDPPIDWYNYEEKKWANIVTATDNHVAYWVWIPKYAYKTDSTTETVDAKFIAKEGDIYKDASGNIVSLDGYQISDAFTFAGESLAGYWMSKYEVSEDYAVDTLSCGANSKEIIVSSGKVDNGGISEIYTVYIDGVESYTGTLPYRVPNIKKAKTYDIALVGQDNVLIGRKQVKAADKIEIDLTGLNPKATYYITYDENGENPQIAGRIDKINPPTDWYNYEEKKWANIVTVTGQEVTYWTYIPRYVYKAYQGIETVDIKFIGKEEDIGQYSLPDSFTFAGEPLAGYWMSKYEVSESTQANPEILMCAEENNQITVTTSNPQGNYQVYFQGEKVYDGSLPYTIHSLQENETYDVLIAKGADVIGRKEVTTKSVIEIDLTGLNPANTYYVYWDEDGTEHSDIPISQPAPTNWYNYSQKKWANIVTRANGLEAYWVYIPRYEYIPYQKAEATDIKFIPKSQTTPDNGYQISDAFTFAGQELAGYWMCKYEVSESN